MKKILMSVMLMPVMALAESRESANGYTWIYEKKNGAVRILAITPNPTGTLTVPSTLGGTAVKWFGCGPCVGPYIDDEDNEYEFKFPSATSFNIPTSVEFLSRTYFEDGLWWRNQSGDMLILGEWAIGLKSNLENLVIPPGVKKLAANFAALWDGGSKLSSVAFPDELKVICTAAFCTCKGLRDVHVPASVEMIGEGAFADVPGPFYFHGQKPKTADCMGLTSSEGSEGGANDPFYASESDSRVIYFKRGTAGWTDGGTWCGLKTYAWDPDGEDPGDPDGVPFSGSEKHIFNGLVYDKGPCGLIQVTTAKETSKGVKVGGFVMLEDSKKATIKAATVQIKGGTLNVSTPVGKIGNISLKIDGSGFSGKLGSMTVESAPPNEDNGVLKATITMSYFEDGSSKLKRRSLTLNGIMVDGEAFGTVTDKKTKNTKKFSAGID